METPSPALPETLVVADLDAPMAFLRVPGTSLPERFNACSISKECYLESKESK